MSMSSSVADAPIVSPDRVRNAVQGMLRAAQARGWTDDQLEQLSGVKKRTIKSYRIDGKEPCLSTALSLAIILGGEAMNALTSLAGYSARPLDEADELQPTHVVAGIASAFAVIAQAAADNHFDHLERPAVRDAADKIIATVLPFSRSGEAA